MKYGLLTYTSEFKDFNVGDYIQSLAAEQFLPSKPDYLINREKLNSFSEEEAKIILNGWFTHHPINWMPSEMLKPLFISFHISSLVYNQMLVPESINYLKKHEPIGCRDIDTMNLLLQNGVEAYFSGCLTLTLGRTYKSNLKNDEILFVDPHVYRSKNFFFILKNFFQLLFCFRFILKLSKRKEENQNLKSIYRTLLFYNQYGKCFNKQELLNAGYIKHYYITDKFTNESQKFQLAEQLLNRYAKAKLIITSRIHCALPATGLETPVIYIDDVQQDISSSCRLNGLLDFFNVIENRKGVLCGSFFNEFRKYPTKSEIKNPIKYVSFKQLLEEKCEKFVNEN